MKQRLLSATGVFGFLVVACAGKSFHDVGDVNGAVNSGSTEGGGTSGTSGAGLSTGGTGDGFCSLGGGGLGGRSWGWSAGGPSYGQENRPCDSGNGCVVEDAADIVAFTGDSSFFYAAYAGIQAERHENDETLVEYGRIAAIDVASELRMGLETGLLHPRAIFLTATHTYVYYDIDGQDVLGRVPRFGCKLIEIVQRDATPSVDGEEASRTCFVADGSTGYFLMPGAIYRIGAEESTARPFVAADATSLVVDGGYLYFTAFRDRTTPIDEPGALQIWRASLDGSAPELVTTDGFPFIQAAYGTLYALDQTGDQAYIVTMPANGGAWTRLTPALTGASPQRLQVVGNRYYYDSFSPGASHWELIEGRLDNPSSPKVLLSIEDANVPSWFGTDGGAYWANQSPNGWVKAYWRRSF